jgi:uncharacterized membrane protein YqjE
MAHNGERPFVEIFQSIGSNIQDIVRSEVSLAKAELQAEAKKSGKAGTILLAGATVGFYAVGLMLLAIVYALSLIVSAWLAALLVAFVVSVVSAGLIMVGCSRWKELHQSRNR